MGKLRYDLATRKVAIADHAPRDTAAASSAGLHVDDIAFHLVLRADRNPLSVIRIIIVTLAALYPFL